MRRTGWVRISVAVVSVAALIAAWCIESDSIKTIAVVASPIEEYQSVVGAIQQQAEAQVMLSDYAETTMQHQALALQQPDAWIWLAEHAHQIDAMAEQTRVVMPSSQYAMVNMQAMTTLVHQHIFASLQKRDDLAVVLPPAQSFRASVVEPLLTQADAAGAFSVHYFSSEQSLIELAQLKGLDAVLVTGNLATDAVIRTLKQHEQLQTTHVFAIGHAYALLDAVNAGTLDGVIFLPPHQLARALLQPLMAPDSPVDIEPVWVNKANVDAVMKAAQETI